MTVTEIVHEKTQNWDYSISAGVDKKRVDTIQQNWLQIQREYKTASIDFHDMKSVKPVNLA